MAKEKDPTLAESATSRALAAYREAMEGHKTLHVELVEGQAADDDVIRFWVVQVNKKTVRAGLVYRYPGRQGSQFHGTDGTREQVVRWLSEHGVPTVRLSNTEAPMNDKS